MLAGENWICAADHSTLRSCQQLSSRMEELPQQIGRAQFCDRLLREVIHATWFKQR